MKNSNKIILSILALSLFVFVGCMERESGDVAPIIDPNTHPTLTITPVDTSINGSTINEGGALAIAYTLELSAPLTRAVHVSARQVGGTADSDDYAFSRVAIAPYTTEATFVVSIAADGVIEDTETLELEIGAFTIDNMFDVNPNSDIAELSLTIENCATCITCDWTIDMHDAYGDGWNNAMITFDIEGTMSDYTLAAGFEGTTMVPVNDSSNITISYTAGDWDEEVTYEIYDANGVLVHSDGPTPATGVIYTGYNTCP